MPKRKGKIGHGISDRVVPLDYSRITSDADVPGLIIVAEEGSKPTDPSLSRSFYYNNEKIDTEALSKYWDGPHSDESIVRSAERQLNAVRDLAVNEKGATRIEPHVIHDPRLENVHYDVHSNNTITIHVDNAHESYDESKLETITYNESSISYKGVTPDVVNMNVYEAAKSRLEKYGEELKLRDNVPDVNSYAIGHEVNKFCEENKRLWDKFDELEGQSITIASSDAGDVTYAKACYKEVGTVHCRHSDLKVDLNAYQRNDRKRANFSKDDRKRMFFEGLDELYGHNRVNGDSHMPGVIHVREERSGTVFSAYGDSKCWPMDSAALDRAMVENTNAKKVEPFVIPDPNWENMSYEIYANGDVVAGDNRGMVVSMHRSLDVVDFPDGTQEHGTENFVQRVNGCYKSFNCARREKPLELDYEKIRNEFADFYRNVNTLMEEAKGSNEKHNKLVKTVNDRFKLTSDHFYESVQREISKNSSKTVFKEIPSVDASVSDDTQYEG